MSLPWYSDASWYDMRNYKWLIWKAFLSDSEGYTATPPTCFAFLSPKWLCYINSLLSLTPGNVPFLSETKSALSAWDLHNQKAQYWVKVTLGFHPTQAWPQRSLRWTFSRYQTSYLPFMNAPDILWYSLLVVCCASTWAK